MALSLTLKDSINLTEDTLQAGVIETMATESKILSVLPFMNIEGSGYNYNVETELSDVQFRAVGEEIKAGTPKFENRTEALKILADEATVDTFQVAVHGNVNDLMAIETALKAKAVAHKFEKTFLTGNSKTSVNEFDGIDVRITESQVVPAAEAVVDGVDTLLDKILGGADALIMNKKTRRKFVAENRSYITYTTNEFGAKLANYGDVTILDVEEEILATDDIYAVKFGVKEGVSGLQNGGITVTDLGQVDNAPQMKTRIEWFCGLAVFNDKTIAKLAAGTAPKK